MRHADVAAGTTEYLPDRGLLGAETVQIGVSDQF